MRIVVMGTGPFAVPSAQRILELGHEIPVVVTRPVADPPPKKLPPRPVADWAQRHGLALWEPASINSPDAIEQLAGYRPDLLFVCDYGQILSAACLATSRFGGINLHGSLLPRHRGAAPVQWALLTGDTQAGVTVIHMTPKLDAGPAIAVRSTEIYADETAGELEPRLATIGVSATEESLKLLSVWDGEASLGIVQDRLYVTRAPRFSKSDGQLDFRLPADYLVRLVRACQPWPGTFAELVWPSGKMIRVLVRAARSRGTDAVVDLSRCGLVTELDAASLGDDWCGSWAKLLSVETTEGTFLVSRVQPAGKREMDVAEFLRGHPLEIGTRFALPSNPCLKLTD